jgi:hypothetical protein
MATDEFVKIRPLDFFSEASEVLEALNIKEEGGMMSRQHPKQTLAFFLCLPAGAVQVSSNWKRVDQQVGSFSCARITRVDRLVYVPHSQPRLGNDSRWGQAGLTLSDGCLPDPPWQG